MLGGFGHAAGGPVDDVGYHAVLFLHDGLDGRRDGNGVAMGGHRFGAPCNGLVAHQRAHPVVDEHGMVAPHGRLQCRQAVADGFLPRGTTRNHIDDLGDVVMGDLLLQEGNPILQAHYHDAVDSRVVLEGLDGIQDDGLSVQLKELLGPRFGVHPLARSTSENKGVVHGQLLLSASLAVFAYYDALRAKRTPGTSFSRSTASMTRSAA